MRWTLAPFLLTLGLLFTDPACAQEQGYDVGDRFPDFAFPDLDGELRRVSELRGQTVLLIQFASW